MLRKNNPSVSLSRSRIVSTEEKIATLGFSATTIAICLFEARTLEKERRTNSRSYQRWMSTALVHHISGSLAFKRQSSLCSFQLLRRVDEHCATIYILHSHTHALYISPLTCACTHTLTHTLYLSHSSTLTFRFARTLSDSFGTHIWQHDRMHSTLSPSLPISFSFSISLPFALSLFLFRIFSICSLVLSRN